MNITANARPAQFELFLQFKPLLLIISALAAFVAMMIYTFKLWENDVFFSWSYGAGWTTVAMALIGIVLIMADR